MLVTQDSNFSMDHTLTPTEPNMADSPQEKAYVLPEIVHPPNYEKTYNQTDPKVRHSQSDKEIATEGICFNKVSFINSANFMSFTISTN